MVAPLPLVAPALQAILSIQPTNTRLKDTRSKLETGLRRLQDELPLIEAKLWKHELPELQELAYDIEDFLPDICIPGRLGFILTALGLGKGLEQKDIIDYFLQKVEIILKVNETGASGSVEDEKKVRSRSSVEDEEQERLRSSVEDEAKSELVELLSAADGPLRVVSIVGFNGLGKTALARAVYHDPDVAKIFRYKALVVASECSRPTGDATDPKQEKIDLLEEKKIYLLKKILTKVRACESETPAAAPMDDTSAAGRSGDNLTHLTDELRTLLTQKRYLVVVDDIKDNTLYEILKDVFRNDKKSGSRIIVTTSIQSVANSLSCGRYRYTMRGLNEEDSLELLSREMFGSKGRNQAIVKSCESILSKCNGSPLALVSAAKHLKADLMPDHCRRLGEALGTFVSDAGNGSAFLELKRSLDECYGSLPKYHDRMCLLSVTMSPPDQQINKNSLLRRWIAEGLVSAHEQISAMDVASNSFKGFVNRSIIDPGLTGSNSKVKRYQVQGIMAEFIFHKSAYAANFVTLVHGEDRHPPNRFERYRIRRLFISDETDEVVTIRDDIKTELSVIRWLTVCSSTRIAFLRECLPKCMRLRVLDLGGCKGINKEVLAKICKLKMYLKYLSLRGSDVKQIPKAITELVKLETLDIRETEVNQLPIEVLLMPALVHLFGKFELVLLSQKGKESQPNVVMGLRRAIEKKKKDKHFPWKSNLETLVKKKEDKHFRWESNLETLSGVIVGNVEENLKEIMPHAKKLKKVKMITMESVLPVKNLTGSEVLDSLSVDSSNHPIAMLTDEFLKPIIGAWKIKSLKLRGLLQGLPGASESFMKLQLVWKLHLYSTGLRWADLASLQQMSCLYELKLVEGPHVFGIESFIVKEDGFSSLKQLCIEAPELPEVQLEEGATRCLVSLELMLTPGQNHATTAEITMAEPETPIQDEAMPSQVLHQTGTSEMTTHELRAKSIEDIEHRLGVKGLLPLENLNEVILHHSTRDEIMQYWKEVSNRHINKPYIKKSNRGGLDDRRFIVGGQ